MATILPLLFTKTFTYRLNVTLNFKDNQTSYFECYFHNNIKVSQHHILIKCGIWTNLLAIREDRKPADTYDCSNLRGWQPLTLMPDGETLGYLDWQSVSGSSSTPSALLLFGVTATLPGHWHRHDQDWSWISQSYHDLQVSLPICPKICNGKWRKGEDVINPEEWFLEYYYSIVHYHNIWDIRNSVFHWAVSLSSGHPALGWQSQWWEIHHLSFHSWSQEQVKQLKLAFTTTQILAVMMRMKVLAGVKIL